MTNNLSSDFELLKEIKIRDSIQAKEILWLKYQSKIASSYFSAREVYHVMGVSLEDYIQESYFAFAKAIAYINLEKMEASGSHFGTSFYYYLLKLKYKYKRELEKYGINIYLSQFIEDQPTGMDPLIGHFSREYTEKTAINFDDEVKKQSGIKCIREYVSNLEGNNKVIMELYLSNKKVTEISKTLELRYAEVYSIIKNAKKELKKNYQSVAII